MKLDVLADWLVRMARWCSGWGVGLVIERSRVRLPASALAYVNSAFHPSWVGKSSTSLLAGVKAGRVHLCRVAGNTV